jgi:hypothetical protein
MANAGRGTVISRGQNPVVLDNYRPHGPAQAGGTPGHKIGYIHKIGIPGGAFVRSGHGLIRPFIAKPPLVFKSRFNALSRFDAGL